jgi:peroxiredoxin Q/BCP
MADWLLSPGDPAPDFTLADQNGNQVSLGNFAGRKLAIFFFPKALTPG